VQIRDIPDNLASMISDVLIMDLPLPSRISAPVSLIRISALIVVSCSTVGRKLYFEIGDFVEGVIVLFPLSTQLEDVMFLVVPQQAGVVLATARTLQCQ
jgi:hypothetical protein